jgi:rod shape-determining protein MreC
MRTAASENDVLKQRVQELEMQVQEKQTLSAENVRLKSLLEFKSGSKIEIVSAKIIGRDPSSWFGALVINRGSLDKVDLNMPVVTPGGVIGRVTAISPLTAQVTLITDDKSSEAAIVGELGNSGARGVVRGMNDRETLEMRYVPVSLDVKVGETVYTTGQDRLYPPGLRIGEVVEVRPGAATASHTIYVRSVAGISSLDEVAVLLYKPTPRERFEKTIPNAVNAEQMEQER